MEKQDCQIQYLTNHLRCSEPWYKCTDVYKKEDFGKIMRDCLNHVVNEQNVNVLLIGSCCIKKFGDRTLKGKLDVILKIFMAIVVLNVLHLKRIIITNVVIYALKHIKVNLLMA